jgi:hypothetical protein
MKMSIKALAVAAPLALAPFASHAAVVISGNFCSTAPVENSLSGGENGVSGLGGEAVGLNTGPGQWFNDLTQTTAAQGNSQGFGYGPVDSTTGAGALARPGAAGDNLFYNDGTGVTDAFTLSWTGDLQDDFDARAPATSRSDELMGGFLQGVETAGGDITLVSSSSMDAVIAEAAGKLGVEAAGLTYDLYLYIDSELSEMGSYSATVTDDNGSYTFYGNNAADFIGTEPGGTFTPGTYTFVQADFASEAAAVAAGDSNYVRFTGLTGDFSVTLQGLTANTIPGVTTSAGIALNGFEIVIPAPAPLALLAAGLIGLGLSRRKAKS